MYAWVDRETGEPFERTERSCEVDDRDNPVVAELLDVNGNVIRQWRERAPIGFL